MNRWLSDDGCRDGISIEGRLDRLRGLEKLYEGLGNWFPPAEASELIDGDFARGTLRGGEGIWDADTLLLEESFRASDIHEAPVDEALSSSELSAGTDSTLPTGRACGNLGAPSRGREYPCEEAESVARPLFAPIG